MARPSKYSEALAREVCERISTSSSGLVKIAKDPDMPALRTIHKWLNEHEEFMHMYEEAKRQQAELLAQEIIDIADDAEQDMEIDEEGRIRVRSEHIQRSRLRVDARKWVAAKLLPRKYGDKLDVTSDGEKLEPTRIIIEHIKPGDHADGAD